MGIFIKIIILIPVFIEVIILGMVLGLLLLINSFTVLFNGTYFDPAYEIGLGIMKLNTKIYFFISGLTDKYPGFNFTIDDTFQLDIVKPENPNRLFAIPIFGGLVRALLLIPFFIFQTVMQYAAFIGIVFSSFPVLFTGKYPESAYEKARDYYRIYLASSAYMWGFSDEYPSFYVSLNHKNIKILLIVLGIITLLFYGGASIAGSLAEKSMKNYNKEYIPSEYQFKIPSDSPDDSDI